MAVPSPLSVKLTPGGSVPDSEIVATGLPVVCTEKDPGAPTVKPTDFLLVMAGACWTVMVSVCCAEP